MKLSKIDEDLVIGILATGIGLLILTVGVKAIENTGDGAIFAMIMAFMIAGVFMFVGGILQIAYAFCQFFLDFIFSLLE